MRKRSYAYVVIVLAVVLFYGLIAIGQMCAAEKQQPQQQENRVVRFFKNLINWPFGVTKKSAEAVGRTTEKAVTTGTTTASSAVETVTGKPEKIKDVIVEPVKGTAETAYTAVEGAVRAPIEGTEEAFKSEETK